MNLADLTLPEMFSQDQEAPYSFPEFARLHIALLEFSGPERQVAAAMALADICVYQVTILQGALILWSLKAGG